MPPACTNASLQPPSSYADHRPWSLPSTILSATMTGAARELSGPRDNPRSSRSRFRGCRRYSQIYHPTSHAVILSMMGWQPQDSNLPAQAVFLDSGREKSIHSRCLPERQCQLPLQPPVLGWMAFGRPKRSASFEGLTLMR